MNTKTYERLLNNHVQGILSKSVYELKKLMFKAENLWEDGFLWSSMVKRITSSPQFENGMIFAGSEGCGKHSAAEVAIKSIMENKCKNGTDESVFGFIYLTGDDFVFSEKMIDADIEYRSELETEDYCLDIVHLFIERLLNCVLGKFGGVYTDKTIVILMDNIKKSEYCNQIYKWVNYYLNIMRLDKYSENEYPNMYVFVVDDDVLNIPHSLREELTLRKMDLPNEDERTKYINHILTDSSSQKQLVDVIVRESDGMNYLEIRDMILEINKMFIHDENIIKKLAKNMLMRSIQAVGTVPVINSGIGDTTALSEVMDKMINKRAAENQNPYQNQQFSINTLPDNLKNEEDGLEGGRPDAEKIREDAKKISLGKFFKSSGIDLEGLLMDRNDNHKSEKLN